MTVRDEPALLPRTHVSRPRSRRDQDLGTRLCRHPRQRSLRAGHTRPAQHRCAVSSTRSRPLTPLQPRNTSSTSSSPRQPIPRPPLPEHTLVFPHPRPVQPSPSLPSPASTPSPPPRKPPNTARLPPRRRAPRPMQTHSQPPPSINRSPARARRHLLQTHPRRPSRPPRMATLCPQLQSLALESVYVASPSHPLPTNQSASASARTLPLPKDKTPQIASTKPTKNCRNAALPLSSPIPP